MKWGFYRKRNAMKVTDNCTGLSQCLFLIHLAKYCSKKEAVKKNYGIYIGQIVAAVIPIRVRNCIKQQNEESMRNYR
jgi:hypothetical protein